MKLDTLIEGYQRKCEWKNSSSVTSNYQCYFPSQFAIIYFSEAYL